MPFQSGPVNLQQGNQAEFVVEFLDTDGNTTVPSSGTLTITFTNTSNSTDSTTIALTATNSFFTGTWSLSSTAALGLATWEATAPGITSPAASGQIRVIDRDGI